MTSRSSLRAVATITEDEIRELAKAKEVLLGWKQ